MNKIWNEKIMQQPKINLERLKNVGMNSKSWNKYINYYKNQIYDLNLTVSIMTDDYMFLAVNKTLFMIN